MHCIGQDASYFGARELGRRKLAGAKHGSNLRATQADAVFDGMRAGFLRCHVPAAVAEERVLEEQWLNAELSRLELREDMLGVVGAVIVADTGMIPSHDEMRATEILADEGVKNRLPRAAVPHRGGVDREQD